MNQAQAEIVRHHQVIEAWLRGDADDFAPFAAAQAPDFTMVGPDGEALSAEQVLQWVQASHGQAPDVRIDIRDVRVVSASGELIVATYQEWQLGRGRLSTVVLRHEPAAPGGLTWLHLHESWLP